MRKNIDTARKKIENRPETEQVYIDGDTSEVILRALVEDVTGEGLPSGFEETVESLPNVEIERTKFVGIGVEVSMR